ncbi:MAG: hypothetical protein IJU72_09295 [Bacteroidales bacterium]|nr:hypothetical protein [Bacteroidales bacterium]
MALKSFFTVGKPRGFNYQPRYYDERKEAARNREARIRRELGLSSDQEQYIPNIRGQFQSARHHTAASGKRSSGRTLIIALMLVAICYMLLQRPELARIFGLAQ